MIKVTPRDSPQIGLIGDCIGFILELTTSREGLCKSFVPCSLSRPLFIHIIQIWTPLASCFHFCSFILNVIWLQSVCPLVACKTSSVSAALHTFLFSCCSFFVLCNVILTFFQSLICGPSSSCNIDHSLLLCLGTIVSCLETHFNGSSSHGIVCMIPFCKF